MDKLPEAEHILRPLLLPLRIAGIYHGHSNVSRIAHVVYGAVLTLLVVIACLGEGYCTYISGMSSSTSFKLMSMTQFIILIPLTACYVFLLPRRLKRFLELWTKSSTHHTVHEVLSQRFRRLFSCVIFLSSLFIVVLMSLIYYMVIIGKEYFKCLGIDMTVPWPNNILTNISSLVTSYQGIMMFLTYTVCAHIVKKEFNNIKTKLDFLVQGVKLLDTEDILNCRQEHEAVCVLLRRADDIFLPFSLFTYVYGILFQCLAVYSVLYEPDSGNRTFLLLASVIFFITFVIAGVNAATVHSSTHGLLETLLELKTHKLTDGAYQEVILFVTKLISTNVGLTVMNIFVLSKTTILTILGTMISYLIVAIQFNPNDTACDCANSTTTL